MFILDAMIAMGYVTSVRKDRAGGTTTLFLANGKVWTLSADDFSKLFRIRVSE